MLKKLLRRIQKKKRKKVNIIGVNIDECFELGYIIKPHRLNGAVDIYLDTDFPEDYKKLESLFVNLRQKLVPFFIDSIADGFRQNSGHYHGGQTE